MKGLMRSLPVESRYGFNNPRASSVLTDHGAKGRFRHQRTCDEDLAGEFPEGTAVTLLAHLDLELITRLHGLAEATGVNRHEVDQLAGDAAFERLHHENCRGLRHRFDDKDAWHYWLAWEMPLKETLVDGDVLQAHGAFIRHQISDSIDHQHRVAMRNHLHDLHDVEAAKLLGRGLLGPFLLFRHCLFPDFRNGASLHESCPL